MTVALDAQNPLPPRRSLPEHKRGTFSTSPVQPSASMDSLWSRSDLGSQFLPPVLPPQGSHPLRTGKSQRRHHDSNHRQQTQPHNECQQLHSPSSSLCSWPPCCSCCGCSCSCCGCPLSGRVALESESYSPQPTPKSLSTPLCSGDCGLVCMDVNREANL